MRNADDQRRFGLKRRGLTAMCPTLAVVLSFLSIFAAKHFSFTNPVTISIGGSVYGANAGLMQR